MVPNGWEVKSPSKLFKLFSGFAFKSSDAKESGAKWLKIANVGIGEIKWDADSFLPEHFLLEHKKYLLTKGDIVVALTRPTLGNKLKVARLTKDSDTSLLNQRVAKIVCKDNVDSEFTFQVLRSDQFAFRINVGLLGTDPPNLSVKVLEDFTIPVPPLPEQRKIAQILSTWDRGIATTEKLIDASKQQKKALMQQLLTGKKRLVNPETGKVFKGDWEATTISQLITESRLTGTNGELAKKITVKLYGRGVTKKEEKRLGSESTKYYKRKAGQFIYSKLDFLNGAFGIIPQSLDGYESTLDLPAFDFTQNVIPKWFIEFVSRDDFYTSNLGLANGGRKARRVNPKDLLQIKVRLPSIKEQQKIASVLNAADKEIELLEAKLAHFKQEKKALMQQLLTGKRRVNIAETKVTTEEILEAEVA